MKGDYGVWYLQIIYRYQWNEDKKINVIDYGCISDKLDTFISAFASETAILGEISGF